MNRMPSKEYLRWARDRPTPQNVRSVNADNAAVYFKELGVCPFVWWAHPNQKNSPHEFERMDLYDFLSGEWLSLMEDPSVDVRAMTEALFPHLSDPRNKEILDGIYAKIYDEARECL